MDTSLTPYRRTDLSHEARLDDLLARMTLEEKIAQLHCHGRIAEMSDQLYDRDGRLAPEKWATFFPHGMCQLGRPSQVNGPRAAAELTNAIQKYLCEETRLGIPAMFNEEGLHGLVGVGSTSFPQAIALASAWDEDLVERVFQVVAKEARLRGSNYIYTPVVDLARDARWGRVEETFGEDPWLVSRMGVAAVNGLQGREPEDGGERVLAPDKTIAAIKHFAVHGQPETGANSAPGNISERIIREQFLPPFQAAIVEAGAEAVMASYNEVDGIPSHTNPWLLQEVLRDEWGFEGFVTSDGQGVQQLVTLHQVAADAADAARQAIEAGVDVEVPRGECYPSLVELVRGGQVSMEVIDRAVRRILRAKLRLGLLDATPYVDPDEAERVVNCPKHRQLALEAARKAMVLLKNQGDLLPFDPAKINRLAVIGPNAADLHLGGYAVDPGCGTSILEGLRQKMGQKMEVAYAEGCRITEGVQGWQAWWENEVILADPAADTPRVAEAVELARRSDGVVLVLGENEGTCREGWWFDHLGDRDSLDLLGRQEELALAVLETGVPTVIVLINGRPLTINSLAEKAAAILECWYLGQETGTAVAEVLFGEVNPSGKLPVTFPRSVGQLPAYYYHKPSARRGYLFTTDAPLFPFGHGLSYTHFTYENLRLSASQIREGEEVRVCVDVTNTGTRAGDEIVQLYIHDQVSTITRPVLELKGFRRISLQPGETRSVEFELGFQQLASLGRDMQPVVEPGLFDILAGSSSAQLERVVLEVSV